MIYERDLQPELMDQPDLDPSLHVSALRGLHRINIVSRSAAILWPTIAEVARQVSPLPVRVLDIACGGGDIAVSLARRAKRAGISIEISGCDISDCAVREARQRACAAGLQNVQFFNLNVLEDSLPADFDVLTCSLFLHHLSEEQAAALLQRMAAAARRSVMICDLERSWLGYGLAWLGCRLLTRSPVVHVDGPRSVAAAFAVSEISALAQRCGLDHATISHHWPERWLLAWRKA